MWQLFVEYAIGPAFLFTLHNPMTVTAGCFALLALTVRGA